MATIPSSGKDRDWVAVLRRTMASAWWGHDVSGIDQAPAVLNGESLLGVNAAGTGTIPLIGTDSANSIIVAGNTVTPFLKTAIFRSGLAATGSGRRFWISDGSYTVVAVQEIHAVAEATAATMTAGVQKLSSAGVAQSMLLTGINLKGTANTLQNGTLIATPSVVAIAPGDSLVWTTSATGTELAGVTLTVLMVPGGRNNQTSVYFANVNAVDSCIFIANRAMTITRIDYTHGVAASGVCTMQISLDTGTVAPGAGTDVLTGTGFDCGATANVLQNGTLVAAATRMAPGDRLSMDFTGTTTGLTSGIVTVTFASTEDRKDVTFYAQANSSHVDTAIFIADRGYEVVAASAAWATAGGAGANCQLTIESGTQAPGAGLDLLANDTNAGFQIDGTANTVEVGTWIDTRRNFMVAGDRLGVDFTATTSIVNLVIAVTLRPA